MSLPRRSGLYDPAHGHDACGVGFVANIQGVASHRIVRHGVEILLNLVHRGACGCDPLTGDGAGILLQMPHEFFVKEGKKLGIRIPARGEYGAGCVFLPRNPKEQRRCQRIVEDKVLAAGQRLLGWRTVPVDESALGPMARQSAPVIKQVIVGSGGLDQTAFERKLYVIRKWA